MSKTHGAQEEPRRQNKKSRGRVEREEGVEKLAAPLPTFPPCAHSFQNLIPDGQSLAQALLTWAPQTELTLNNSNLHCTREQAYPSSPQEPPKVQEVPTPNLILLRDFAGQRGKRISWAPHQPAMSRWQNHCG